MIDINAGGQITYLDMYNAPYDAGKEYVVSLVFDGHEVDFKMPALTIVYPRLTTWQPVVQL